MPRSPQERFARKNEAEDLRRAFDILDTKGYVPKTRRARARNASAATTPILTRSARCSPCVCPRSDGKIDADEVEQVFKQLGHKCKRVRSTRTQLQHSASPPSLCVLAPDAQCAAENVGRASGGH